MEIQIAKIYPPKQAGWSASIKAGDGNYYGVKESVASTLSEGQTIQADVVVKDRNGKTYRDITKIYGNESPAKPAASSPAAHSPAPRYGSSDPETAERIFVCGVVNAVAPKVYEKMGLLNSEQLTAIVQVARTTWADTFGRKAE